MGQRSDKTRLSPARGAAQRRLQDGSRDALVREEPLVLEVDGTPLVTMRTPGQDEDFALGFLLSEGLIRSPADIVSLDFQKGIPLDEPGPGPQGDGHLADRIVVRLARSAPSPRREALRRTHEIRPSCGLCGLEDLRSLVPDGRLAPGVPRISRPRLAALLPAFRSRQRLFDATGGCHGAAIARPDGTMAGFGEDIGRHNAVDKAVGQAVRAGQDLGRAVALLSGRAGYDLVAKLLRCSCPIILSVSAASALAFDLCRETGATLVGFARAGRLKVYWDEGRIVADSQASG